MDRRSFLATGAFTTVALAGATRRPAAAADMGGTSRSPPASAPRLQAISDSALDGFTLVCSFQETASEWRVFEDRRHPDGDLVFLNAQGSALILTKRLEATYSLAELPHLGLDLKTIARADRDLLADHLLAGGGDPDPIKVRDAAPPVGSQIDVKTLGARLLWTFFVGARRQADTMPITPAGSTRNYHVNQVFPRLSTDQTLVARRSEALLGGGLPALVKVFPLTTTSHYEVVVFGDVRARDRFMVQTWQRLSLIEDGRAVEVVYAGSYCPYTPSRQAPDPADFYRALLSFVGGWRAELKDMCQATLPDAAWTDMVDHAFIKEIMVRPDGVYPKYGAVDRDYYGSEYDGFQDTFTSSLFANLEWGRFDQARAVTNNYFSDFVEPDGVVNMRGPETAQFGLTLSLLVRYLEYTGDAALLITHLSKIRNTAKILTDLHDQSLKLATSDPGYGLISGWDESDSCLFADPSIWRRPYFANSAFAARGLAALAQVWPALDPSGVALARTWGDRAKRLRAAVSSSVRSSMRREMSPPYVPPLPGEGRTFRQSLAEQVPSPQGWPHRSYSELLQAGVLPDDLAGAVIDTMRAYGATTLGVVANVGAPSDDGRDILGFISYGYAQQLLRLDRIEEFLLFLYSHRYHAHTPGSWTAAEVADITGGLPLFCIPAQLTIPLLVRWMLVYEDEDVDRLHLARATPRDWLATPRGIAIADAPTRWGKVSLTLRVDADTRSLSAKVSFAERRRPAEVWLKLRLPAGMGVTNLVVNGRPGQFQGEVLRFIPDRAQHFDITGDISLTAS